MRQAFTLRALQHLITTCMLQGRAPSILDSEIVEWPRYARDVLASCDDVFAIELSTEYIVDPVSLVMCMPVSPPQLLPALGSVGDWRFRISVGLKT